METAVKTISSSEFRKAYFTAVEEAYRPKSNLSGWSVYVFSDLTISGALSQNTTFAEPSLCSVDVWGQDLDSSYFDIKNYNDREQKLIARENGMIGRGWCKLTQKSLQECEIPFSIIDGSDELMNSYYEAVERLESEGYTFN